MKAVIFSGTSEGRELFRFLIDNGIDAVVSVATEYGAKLQIEAIKNISTNIFSQNGMPSKAENGSIHVGRLNPQQMTAFIAGCDIVIDATHPYACEVTKNIRFAAETSGIRYIRLLREKSTADDIYTIESMNAAVEYLNKNIKDRNIFASTGSKEAEKLTEIENFKKRVFIRILNLDKLIQRCIALGFPENHIIAGRPPYSLEQNIKHYMAANAHCLITRDTAQAGGFYEKISAARRLDIKVIMLRRPLDEIGFSLSEVKDLLFKS